MTRPDDTERTWTERKPYPEAAREKYGASTGRPSAPAATANVVEGWHVAAPTDEELRARRDEAPAPPDDEEPPDVARPRTTLPYGVRPAPAYATRANVLRGGGRGPAPPTEEVLAPKRPAPSRAERVRQERAERVRQERAQYARPERPSEPERPSHPPEGAGRATYPSLDRVSVP